MSSRERERRARNLKPCHEVWTRNGWHRVQSVTPDGRGDVLIALAGHAAWSARPNALVRSRIAAGQQAEVVRERQRVEQWGDYFNPTGNKEA